MGYTFALTAAVIIAFVALGEAKSCDCQCSSTPISTLAYSDASSTLGGGSSAATVSSSVSEGSSPASEAATSASDATHRKWTLA
uniref:Secreted protein n=1 Tax=Panagrellus redivivus TaxID=6233 RepID=A0A7E4ZVV4_PANRE